MTRPDREQLATVRTALERRESIFAVHYACESFITAKDHPPGVASIAISDLLNGEVFAFSRTDCPQGTGDDDCERQLLERFYEELESRIEDICLHWNMDRPEYGFSALATRWRYLTPVEPPCTAPRHRYDVDTLFISQFGEQYAPHGKLESTARLNDLDMRSFLNGKEEADEYGKRDWAKLTRSASSKAKIIGELLIRLANGTVKTAGSAGLISFARSQLDSVQTVLALADRFKYVQVSLKKRPQNREPLVCNDEYDDQYLLRALLVQFFDDVRDEEYSPSYAGGNSRIDFILPAYQLGVELKHTRSSMSDRELGEQLVVDRERYGPHPNVTHLVVIVFDYDNNLRNPRGLEQDLQREHSHPDLTVTVKIIDR